MEWDGSFLQAIGILRYAEMRAHDTPGGRDALGHKKSRAWEAYEQAWLYLECCIDNVPKPAGWIAIEEWCANHPSRFGDVELPAKGRKMVWVEEGRTVLDLLAKCIGKRLRERPARPMDELIWKDPRVASLLERLHVPGFPQPLADEVRVHSLTVDAEAGFVVIRIAYDARVARDVEVAVVPLQAPHHVVHVTLKPGGVVDGYFSRGITGCTLPGEVTVRIPGPVWRLQRIAEDTALAIRVSDGTDWFLTAGASAPADPGDPALDDYNPDDFHCMGCGESTPLLIDKSCAPCGLAYLSRMTPRPPEEQGLHASLRESWKDVKCGHCGARSFRWRLCNRRRNILECTSCGRGWEHDGSTITRPDVVERALATPEPGPGWRRAVESGLTKAGYGVPTADWLALSPPVDPTPDWRTAIRMLCAEYLEKARPRNRDRLHPRDHSRDAVPAGRHAEMILASLGA